MNLTNSLETRETLYYGNLIASLRYIDQDEAQELGNFLSAHNYSISDPEFIDEYIHLLESIYSDATDLTDTEIHDQVVSVTKMGIDPASAMPDLSQLIPDTGSLGTDIPDLGTLGVTMPDMGLDGLFIA